MSRFLNFINESMRSLNFSDEQIAEMIKKNCSQYLNETNNGEYMLTRGMKASKPFLTIVPLKNRQPKDTHPLVHKALDDAFEKKFGIRLRSESTFCNLNNKKPLSVYGLAYVVFPYNGYELFFNPKIRDLFLLVPGNKSWGIGNEANIAAHNFIQDAEKVNQIVNGYKKENLKTIVGSLTHGQFGNADIHEIMVICKRYIALSIANERTKNILNLLGLKHD